MTLRSVVQHVRSMIAAGGSHFVFVRDVHGLMRAVEDKALADLHEQAALVVPDGMPLVWLTRLRGNGQEVGRAPGFEIVESCCKELDGGEYRHFFFGGLPGVAEEMASRLKTRFPGLAVVGTYCPPFRDYDLMSPLTEDEREEVEMLKRSGANIIWIGISTPKQEYLMRRFAPHLDRCVQLGVGAAFDMHAGRLPRAPSWMANNGLEWLFRFAREPRRLWRRYLVLAPKFVWLAMTEEWARWRGR